MSRFVVGEDRQQVTLLPEFEGMMSAMRQAGA
jgi:flagellar biogenesis protein FliO